MLVCFWVCERTLIFLSTAEYLCVYVSVLHTHVSLQLSAAKQNLNQPGNNRWSNSGAGQLSASAADVLVQLLALGGFFQFPNSQGPDASLIWDKFVIPLSHTRWIC